MALTRPARLAAAVVLTAAAGLVLPATPAIAATCSTGDGVTVVVDFHELGGGVQSACDASGGGKAASKLFPDNGFPLTYVQRQPGFVCRVSGAPSEDDDSCVNTPPGDAYWGIWWSDGDSGSWSYATKGVGSLNIAEGGSVALSWNGSSTKSPPGISPPAHRDEQPSSTPTAQPSGQSGGGSGGSGGSGGGSGTSGSGSAGSPTPSTATTDPASPGQGESAEGQKSHGEDKGKKRDGKRKDRDDEESAQPTASAPATPDAVLTADPPADAADDGLPTWVAPVGIAGLFGLAGAVGLLRRRSMS